MLFYKAEGFLVDSSEENERRRGTDHAKARELLAKSQEFNEKYCRGSFYFMSRFCDTGVVTVGIMDEGDVDLSKTLRAYLDYLGLEAQDITVTEVTIRQMATMLSSADYLDLIDSDDEVMEKYGMDLVVGGKSRGLRFGENMIEERSREEVFAKAEKHLMSGTFFP